MNASTTKTTISKDGTRIAYEQLGSGPVVVLVDGAFCRRAFGPMPKLAPLLAERFTVIHYDRRGRGRIFFFRPGHETFPTYHDANVQRVIANGVRWAAPDSIATTPFINLRVDPLEPI